MKKHFKKRHQVSEPTDGATYWYLSPWDGNKRSFPSLEKARQAARREHGFSTICYSGPDEPSKIIETLRGYEPLPQE